MGFPIWFGFAGLFDEGIEDKELKQVGLNAEVMLFVCAHFVPVIAASFLVRWGRFVSLSLPLHGAAVDATLTLIHVTVAAYCTSHLPT